MTKNTETARVVTLAEAQTAIKHAFKKNRPVMLWGPPGIGKSDIVRQVAMEQGREVVDIRLTLYDPTDLKGFPFFDEKTKMMSWAQPSELPSDPNSTAVILLDELNSAAPSVQAAAYQLVLDRKIGTYKLPPGVDIVAAGNRDSDRGVTYRMPTPLANRFTHLTLTANADVWLDYAVLHNVHPDVVGYIGFAKQDLYDFDPRSNSIAFATPRSWKFTSDLLEDSEYLPDSSVTDLVAGTIGEGLAVKFMAHRKYAASLPQAADVLDGKVKALTVKEVSAMYSLIISLCYELKQRQAKLSKEKNGDDTWHKSADMFFGFIMANLPTELVVMGAKIALSTYGLPFKVAKLKTYSEFHQRFGKYIVAAVR